MTFEKKQELRYFKVLDDNTTLENPWISKVDIDIVVHKKIAPPTADKIFEDFISHEKRYLDDREHTDFRISDVGRFYYDELKKELETEELDIKLKKITIINSKFQKYTPIVSVIFAALSLITTIIISIVSFNKPEKQYIPLQEMQQLEKTQEQINKSIGQYLDTLRVHQKQ